MAVDTRNKRASCLCLALPFGRVLPNPDGTVDEEDQQQHNFLYSGIDTIAAIESERGRYGFMNSIGRGGI